MTITQPDHGSDLEQQAAGLYRQQFDKITDRAEQIRRERSKTTEAPMPSQNPQSAEIRAAVLAERKRLSDEHRKNAKDPWQAIIAKNNARQTGPGVTNA
ncbi:hypothetical protein [Lamprobacter modestohalophilus]|uniref:hypothetical protein n=1 Tax=Lamprobacter modestohalophilus TaxID=1064514 RepID=UPI0019067C4D|nr:hypothetical protein [Lamprobacter modestohalophilus]